jgi:hypothetical protein
MAMLRGKIHEESPLDALTLEIQWGDDTQPQTVHLEPGATSFSVPHIYRNGGRRCRVAVILRDDEGGSSSGRALLEVVGHDDMPPCPPALRMVRRGSVDCLEWDMEGVIVQEAPAITGPWVDMAPQPQSPLALPMDGERRFFRIRP